MLASTLYSLCLLAAALQPSVASPIDHGPGSSQIAPLYTPPALSEKLINSSYVVMFHDDILPSVFTAHLNFLELAKEAHGVSASDFALEHVYNSAIAKGYAGKLTPEILEMIRRRPEVNYVEQEQIVSGDNMQRDAPWGLARINHRVKLTDRLMHYAYPPTSGAGVTVYVVDTGVFTTHNEFEGRAKWGKSFIPEEGNRDLDGHGTHVAGTIASRKYGVAKKASIVAVKVLDKNGSGKTSNIIAGIEWVHSDAQRILRRPGNKGVVVNLSLGGSPSRAKDDAANNAVKAGLHLVIAAGNQNKDACGHSPASAELPITVGSTTLGDERRSSSNYGKCVDIFAPGSDVLSTGNSGRDSTKVMSGTSMATPHVSGIIAQFLSLYPHWSFHPRSVDTVDATCESYLMSALARAHESLSEFISGFLPSPSRFVAHGMKEDIQPDTQAVLTPLRMKRALLALASKNRLASGTLRAGSPNLLAYNNYTHGAGLWKEEPFMIEYD